MGGARLAERGRLKWARPMQRCWGWAISAALLSNSTGRAKWRKCDRGEFGIDSAHDDGQNDVSSCT